METPSAIFMGEMADVLQHQFVAGDVDVLNPFNFGLFDRGWKEFEPQNNSREGKE